MLLTLIYPTSGNIQIFDKQLKSNRKEILSKVGAIVEKPNFYLYLTPNKNLEILGKISAADIPRKSTMNIPELVNLYEPTVGFDPQGIKEVRELILRRSSEKQITIFVSSHILMYAASILAYTFILFICRKCSWTNNSDYVNSYFTYNYFSTPSGFRSASKTIYFHKLYVRLEFMF